MKIYCILLSLCCCSLFSRIEREEIIPTKESATADTDPCFMENRYFNGGEHLVYKIYYNLGPVWLPAGEVEFSVEENESFYLAEVLGRTYKSYEQIFKVRDRYRSIINKKNLLPVFFLRDVEEGRYFRYDSIFFDQKSLSATSYWGKKKDSVEEYHFNFENCMQDMLSILYYVRNMDFDSVDEGDEIPVHIFFDKEIFNLNVEFYKRAKEKKIRGMGKINCFELKPEAIDGHVFKKNTRLKVAISDDLNRVPVQIESPLKIGSVKAVLLRYDGLKYPLSFY